MAQFLVTVDTTIDGPTIRIAVENALPYGPFSNVQVERYDPENMKDDLSKIAAIKRIRQELLIGLADAKFLADTADKLGESRWGKVRVYSSARGFRVDIL